MILTVEQQQALVKLNQALIEVTDTGLFDSGEAWQAFGTPDVINQFCDGVDRLLERK